ncbi:MAG: pilus assembly protein [Gemmataceae bacterium]|nr:pilus assembly protein [Gemmataceae bacterium]
MIVHSRSAHRRGAAAVETAVVMIPIIMMFFAIFEYGRFTMDLNILNNAVREGCRHALVNNTASTIVADVKGVVNKRIGGRISQFSGQAVTVTVTGTHKGVATPVNDLVPGDLITVSVSGDYAFLNVVPLVKMPTALTMSSSVSMVCEGGT